MKKLVVCASFLLLVSWGCDSDDDFNNFNNARILGYDQALCPCCGGWLIEIDNSTFRFFDLPVESNIDLEEEIFPLEVTLFWSKDRNGCLGDEIKVKKIEKL